MYINKSFLFLLLLPLYLNAQYKVVVASVENKESLNIITNNVKNILKQNKINYKIDFIKTENNYTRIIIPMIPTISEAKKVRKTVSVKFKDSYIREYQISKEKHITENVVVEKKKTIIKKIEQNDNQKVVTTDVFNKNDFEKYKKAVSLFQIRDYDISYKLFNELSLTYLKDDKLNYYLGRSAFELKKFSEAYMAFNKIEIRNELHLRVRLEKARSLYFLRSHDLAILELNRILQYPISIKVRSNVEKFIKKIELEKI